MSKTILAIAFFTILGETGMPWTWEYDWLEANR